MFRFGKDLLSSIQNEVESFLYYFGYVDLPERDNPCGFFQFEKHQPEMVEQFERFKVVNKDMMEWVTRDKEAIRKLDYLCNDPDKLLKDFSYVNPEELLQFNIKE